MSQPTRGQGGLFLIGPNNTKLVEDIEILLPVKFRWILFSGHGGEVENVSANLGGHLVPPIDPKNINLLADVEILRPVKFCWIPFSGFRGEVENASANRGRVGYLVPPIGPKNTKVVEDVEILLHVNFVEFHLVFPIGPKNTSLVEDVKILLPFKFRWIPISGHRGEVENVSVNQRPGWPSCLSDRPENHKLGRGRWNLPSFQHSLNSIQWFQRRSRKCRSQSEAGGHLVFSNGPINTNFVKDVEILLPVNIRWIPFKRRSRKCDKLMTTDNARLQWCTWAFCSGALKREKVLTPPPQTKTKKPPQKQANWNNNNSPNPQETIQILSRPFFYLIKLKEKHWWDLVK